MKRSWLARHPVGFMALYSIFYLSVFHYLESNVPLRSILVHCRLCLLYTSPSPRDS